MIRQIRNKLARSLERRAMRRFYQGVMPSPGLCFDVGANVGERTETLADLGCHVVAIDPQDSCVDALRRRFSSRGRVSIVKAAVGAAAGTAEMHISTASTLSTLSPEWIQTMRRSRRFGDHEWPNRQTVAMTTLDQLIQDFGRPDYIKIDVEGYEHEVLKGLHQPIPLISIEFAPENYHHSAECLGWLGAISPISVNFTSMESFIWAFDEWRTPSLLLEYLARFKGDPVFYGDIFIRSTLTNHDPQ